MCRLLTVKSETPFAVAPHLKNFAAIAKSSKEYQGHGWGCAYLDETVGWKFYKNIDPIWEDDFNRFNETTLLVAHARSVAEQRGRNAEWVEDAIRFSESITETEALRKMDATSRNLLRLADITSEIKRQMASLKR